jgi:hypothetical protein
MSSITYSSVQAADAFGYIGTDLATIRRVMRPKVSEHCQSTDTII